MGIITKIDVGGVVYDLGGNSFRTLDNISDADTIGILQPSDIYIIDNSDLLLHKNTPEGLSQVWLSGEVFKKRTSVSISATTGETTWGEWKEYQNNSDIKIEWSSTFNMNDYKTQGKYYIAGERLQSENDNLPIMNASSGHTISGQLTVLDASLSDAEQCITQYLKLTNRFGSEGKEYIRTYNKYSNGSEGWSAWRELKQTTNLNQISDAELKNYTENGMYEGVIMNGSDISWIESAIEKFFADLPMSGGAEPIPSGTLFTMDVLNNYAVVRAASQMGITIERSVTQRAKALLITGQYVEIQRTLQGDVWSGWKMINALS